VRILIIGLGIQGHKRRTVAGKDAVATVDPVFPEANYRRVEDVPLDSYDAACVCVPDAAKLPILEYLLSHGKHVLVEKPLLASDNAEIRKIQDLALSKKVICYTAYNHRFEPHLVTLKKWLDAGKIGKIYTARFFYGNGTAQDVKRSPWRDKETGVVSDIGSHLLDMALFLFKDPSFRFKPWKLSTFENRAYDHAVFGSTGTPLVQFEMTLLSWKNTFSADILGELGSLHVEGLCKWGPSIIRARKRVFPSGKPEEETDTIVSADPTWAAEYEYFKTLCKSGRTDLSNDLYINTMLKEMTVPAS